MRLSFLIPLSVTGLLLCGCQRSETTGATGTPQAPASAPAPAAARDTGVANNYAFKGGYPDAPTVQSAYDSLDLNRAITAYRFFYPTVSSVAIFDGSRKVGVALNQRYGYMDTQPKHMGYTLNSDTPYGGIQLDLHDGPFVIELPPGPLLGAVLDINQRWIQDMGLPGPDAGKGGRFLLLPPDYAGEKPTGYYIAQATSYRVIAGIRSIPDQGDLPAAVARMKAVKVYPLKVAASPPQTEWFDMTPEPQNTTPSEWQGNLGFWQALHGVIDSEPPLADARTYYGDLAALGIEKGKPFQPDDRMRRILEQAATIADAQMRVESFADRRPDRVVWSDRKWEWASLRFENGNFDAPAFRDSQAMDKWFYQAIATSPAMFRRDPGAGSLYWLGLRDKDGVYLDGGSTYKLTVPLPVPDRLFWSVTVYDAQTRSQIQTAQGKAALRSLFELKDLSGGSVDLYFGPTAPKGQENRWIQTSPGVGWFVYFRIYGPQPAAFDGSWKPADFERMP